MCNETTEAEDEIYLSNRSATREHSDGHLHQDGHGQNTDGGAEAFDAAPTSPCVEVTSGFARPGDNY